MAYWEVEMRWTRPSAVARAHMAKAGIEDAVRDVLVDAIVRGTVSPEDWRAIVNAQTYTPDDVRQDASEFWQWLYDGAPIPKGI